MQRARHSADRISGLLTKTPKSSPVTGLKARRSLVESLHLESFLPQNGTYKVTSAAPPSPAGKKARESAVGRIAHDSVGRDDPNKHATQESRYMLQSDHVLCSSRSVTGQMSLPPIAAAASAAVVMLPVQLPLELGSGSAPRKVAVAMSGGVDSAVVAKRLVDQGLQVFGVFMRNWDETEELANSNCSIEHDFQDARRVCRQLDIPLQEADFVTQYWQHVFQPFLDKYSQGLTPNPDLVCNRAIKFGPMLRYAELQGAHCMATGHYARLLHRPGQGPLLLKGVDPLKDQSYFLASVPAAALERCMFPVGNSTKQAIRQEAAEARLPISAKRSSAGICFVGRRKFSDFADQYVEPVPGRYFDIDAPFTTAPCENVLAPTYGQRATIGGRLQRSYVVGKDVGAGVVYIAQGALHPALFCDTALLLTPTWVAAHQSPDLTQGRPVRLTFMARYGQPTYWCTLQSAAAAVECGTAFRGSRYSSYPTAAAAQTSNDGQLVVRFDEPMRAVTPGQELVLYDGDVCLGSAMIAQPGESLAEGGLQLPVGWSPLVDSVHMEVLNRSSI